MKDKTDKFRNESVSKLSRKDVNKAARRFYAVVAKCGHVGRHFYAEKTFAVQAENGREAAKIVRTFPRVKHHHKDAIISVEKISQERYDEITRQNFADPYFRCKCVQDQRSYEDPNIFEENDTFSEERPRENSKPNYSGKKRIRNFKKFVRMIDFEDEIPHLSYKRTA